MTRTDSLNANIKAGMTDGIPFDTSASTYGISLTAKTQLDNASNKYQFLLHFRDNDDINFIVEIFKRENWHILEILNFAFRRVYEYLEEHQKYNYSLRLFLSQDIEIPDWKQYTIEVKSELQDFESREELWDKLIEEFDRSYNEYIQRTNIIETDIEKDAYRRISIALN